jgi:hypothetical protein
VSIVVASGASEPPPPPEAAEATLKLSSSITPDVPPPITRFKTGVSMTIPKKIGVENVKLLLLEGLEELSLMAVPVLVLKMSNQKAP